MLLVNHHVTNQICFIPVPPCYLVKQPLLLACLDLLGRSYLQRWVAQHGAPSTSEMGFAHTEHGIKFNGLVEGKIYRKPWFLPSNIGVSCKFSHHQIL